MLHTKAVLLRGRRFGTTRLRAACAAAGLALLAGAGSAGAQQIPEGYEQGIFQLSITDLQPVPITALVSPDGLLLFPLESILRAAGIPFEADSAGVRLETIDRERRGIRARADVRARTVARAGVTTAADSAEMVAADGELYLSSRLLELLLDAEVRPDFGALDLRIQPAAPLPAQLALEAEQRRQLALIRAGALAGPPLPPTPLRQLSGGGVLHYSLSSAAPETRSATVLTVESGFALLGGLAAVGYTASGGGPVVDPALTFRYERFVPEQQWISFVRAGDVFAEGAFFRSMRGVTVTNRPLRREGFFQDVVIDPEVPPGYEIEVYQGGQLIAFSDRAAQDPLRVPLTYGRTDLEVRMIAPSGEVVTTGLLFGVPQSQLPENALEYSAGAGECHFEECTLFFGAADYGVRRWLTLGAGYEAEHDSTGFTHLPFARTTIAPAGGWLGEARVIGDQQLSATALYNGLGALTGNLGIDVRTANVPRATLLPQTRRRFDTRAELGYRRHRVLGRLGGMEGEGIDRRSLGYIAAIPRGVVITQVESFAGSPTELSLSAFQLLRARLLGSALTASGRISTSRHGVRALEAGASGSWHNSLFANLTVGWDRDARLNATLSFSQILPIGQFAGVLSAASGATRATMRADGAIAIDPFSAVEPAAYTGIGFAGIDAFVFRDADGDGVRDSTEAPAAGVSVQAAERSATTDSSGHARIWGLIPWEKTVLRASSDWFEPQWAPARPEVVLRPVAHVFNPVEVALVSTRELVAYVVPGEGVPTSASIGFRLISERDGKVWEGLTLSDGSIYLSGVPVGSYRLELDPEALAFLRATVDQPIRFTIAADGADEFVFELPPIELRRAE